MAINLPIPEKGKFMIGYIFMILGSLTIFWWFQLKFGESELFIKYMFYIGIIIMYVGIDISRPGGFIR